MTIHLCRDFLTLPSASSPGANMYVLSIFMTHVLQFGIVSQVNFPLESSSYRIAQGLTAGLTASINQGSGREYEVAIPTASYAVSNGDINRILVLKSDQYPRHNSGLFRITSASLSTNVLRVDYRSLEFPPVEGGLTWKIYESENVVSSTWRSGSNNGPGYRSNGGSTSSRILLSNLSEFNDWSVRLCLESSSSLIGNVPVGMTVTPGWLNEDAVPTTADFTTDDWHLHGPMWFDSTSSYHMGSGIGVGVVLNGLWTRGQWRITIAGDHEKGTCSLFTRLVTLPTGSDGWVIFGLPDDEEEGIEERLDREEQATRLFVVGSSTPINRQSWRNGYHDDNWLRGMAWGLYGAPTPCVMSSYAPIRNESIHTVLATNRANTPFTGRTELIDVEVLAGTLDAVRNNADARVFDFQPRRIGRLPLTRQGRENFGFWAASTDVSASWLHVTGGIYTVWGGPALSGSVTGSNVTELITSSFIDGTGLSLDVSDDPGSDPFEEVIEQTKDFDATRFRKTYSYFRQEPRNISVERQGSNPSRS